jgi:phosphorylcholine metabolism protein LicD
MSDSVNTDKKYIKHLYRCFYDLHNFFVKNNITYFASGGSILGAIRHKGIIPWDDDVDVEVSYRDIPKIFELKKHLLKAGYKIKKHKEGWIKIDSIKKVDGRKSSIDVFPIFFDKKRTRFYDENVENIWPKAYHNIKDIYPLKQVKFGKGVIIVPKNTKPYLDRLYGKSWSKKGYITMDKYHMDLDKPILVKQGSFVPAKEFASAKKQILLNKKDSILTGKNILFN